MEKDAQSIEPKELTDINLKALANDFAVLLSNHVGGIFTVDLTRFNQIENKGVGLQGYGGELDIVFRVRDESRFTRPRWNQNKEEMETITLDLTGVTP